MNVENLIYEVREYYKWKISSQDSSYYCEVINE